MSAMGSIQRARAPRKQPNLPAAVRVVPVRGRMHLMLWSVPRGRSTAFFRMMAERGDFTVVHEPFSYLVMYGHTDVAGTRASSGPDVIRALLKLPGQVFTKETTGFRSPEFVASPQFLAQTEFLDSVT